MKKTIVFMTGDPASIQGFVDVLQGEIQTKMYTCADTLLSAVKGKKISIDLLVTDLVLEEGNSSTNDFGGKRKNYFCDCASLLYDALTTLEFKGKIIVLSKFSTNHIFNEAANCGKFVDVLSKKIPPLLFLERVKMLLGISAII